jgi:hypothetical protein
MGIGNQGRMPRPPGLTLEAVKAATAGLNSAAWRDRRRYCSLLDAPKWDVPARFRAGRPMPAKRDVPIDR